MTTHLTVTDAEIPALSTLGYLTGIDDDGNFVRFAGDHREVGHIIEALRAGEEVECDVEDYLILDVSPQRQEEPT